MILRTSDSVYEVRESDKLFRKLSSSAATASSWDSYDRLSPVAPGAPAKFFIVQGEQGRVLHYRVLTTSPIVEVLRATA